MTASAGDPTTFDTRGGTHNSRPAPPTQLPDTVYGSADTNPAAPRRLTVTVSDGPPTLIQAFIGGIHLAMSERNWQALFAAVSDVDVPAAPPTHTIVFDDANRTATITTT